MQENEFSKKIHGDFKAYAFAVIVFFFFTPFELAFFPSREAEGRFLSTAFVIFLSQLTKFYSTKGVSYLMIRILTTKFSSSENITYFMCQNVYFASKS